MSPPAQNDLPTAFTTSAPTSARPSTSSNTPISSCAIPGVSALRRSGAFRVTTATAPSKSSSTSPEPATSPPFNRGGAGLRPRRPGSFASDHGPGDAAAAGRHTPAPCPYVTASLRVVVRQSSASRGTRCNRPVAENAFLGHSGSPARRDLEKVQVRHNVLLPPLDELSKAG